MSITIIALREARAGVRDTLALHAVHECDPEQPGRCVIGWHPARTRGCIVAGHCPTCTDAAPCPTATLLEAVAERLEEADHA